MKIKFKESLRIRIQINFDQLCKNVNSPVAMIV
jgi:hypothetical protein